jgi:hypothetical protein
MFASECPALRGCVHGCEHYTDFVRDAIIGHGEFQPQSRKAIDDNWIIAMNGW